MNSIDIDEKLAVFRFMDSKGSQKKYCMDNKWYKINMLGNEGLAEELSSRLLSACNLPENITYVSYKACQINGKYGCVSDSFLKPDEQYISLQILYKNIKHSSLENDIFAISSVKERFDFVVNFVKEVTDLDISDYFRTILLLDMIIANPDRHYGNLGIIKDLSGNYKLAPIFDNGQGLSQNFGITDPLMEYEEKISNLTAATISGSFEMAVLETGGPIFTINYDKLNNILLEYKNSIAKEFLEKQLNRYSKMLDQNLMNEKDTIER